MTRIIQLPGLPLTTTGDPFVMEFGRDPSEFDRLWRLVLMMAVRDRAVSVHWHPWRAAEALGYIVDGTRYSLIRPPAEFDTSVAAAARELVAPSVLHSFAWRWHYLGPHMRVLLRRWLRRPVAGRFRCECEYGPSEWCGVWWHVDGQCGAELHRLDVAVTPIKTLELESMQAATASSPSIT